MARDGWARAARELALAMARQGADRPSIQDALGDWIGEDAIRTRLVVAAWCDKVAADALAAATTKPTPFHPRASTEGGRTPLHPTMAKPSDYIADLTRWLSATDGIAERRAAVHETRNALQQGLALWPDMDVDGGCETVLRRLGWDEDRIALVLDITAEAA